MRGGRRVSPVPPLLSTAAHPGPASDGYTGILPAVISTRKPSARPILSFTSLAPVLPIIVGPPNERKSSKKAGRSRLSCLYAALRENPNKVKAVISASGIGWYGPDPAIPNPRPFEETDPADNDFLGETCRRWEDAISPVTALGKRLVILRTGLVLSRQGGALAEFRKPIRFGIAPILGSGRQIMSWIHIDDLCRLYLQAIEQEAWSGVYNAVAPGPASNSILTIELARRLKGRYFVPVFVPSLLLRLVVGGMSVEVLKSTTVSAAKTRAAGFQFIYPAMEPALDNLLKGRS